MRRIPRPWPPRNVRRDDETAQSLSDANRAFQRELNGRTSPEEKRVVARSTFDGLDKEKLRAGMYPPQRSLCAYCEATLYEGRHPAPRIDHWIPISHDPTQALLWKNLYLSCPRHDTCDGGKQETVPQETNGTLLPWPSDFDYHGHIGFTSQGETYVRTDTGLSDSFREGLAGLIEKHGLHLNHPTLREARKGKIDAEKRKIARRFDGRNLTSEERVAEKDEIASAYEAEGCWVDFISVRLAYLRKTLGVGQPTPPP
ncbi:hypothetical protein KQI84_14440 [bacterium]|nr:hypothetical protein [bacterium]